MRIDRASDHSLLITAGDSISEATHRDVVRLFELLRELPAVRNLHPAYASILISYDPLRRDAADLEREVRERAARIGEVPLPQPRTVEIPVRYGGEFGPDLGDVAAHCGLSPEEVIALHSGTDYLVYFLGFSPGFPYLGGMPQQIAAPRLGTPRRQVPAGSVAIGGSQTGVYPVASPGGWRIIGRTPLKLFDPAQDPPALLRMGDHVRFVPLP